jgi:hypothetical protein
MNEKNRYSTSEEGREEESREGKKLRQSVRKKQSICAEEEEADRE